MDRNKWDAAKIILFPLPFLFLAAYLAGLGFPLPAFLAPTRSSLAIAPGLGDAELKRARGRGEAFAVLGDRLLQLPASPLALRAAALPELPVLGPVLEDLEGGLGQLRKARLVVSRPPSAEELASLKAAARRAGAPLSIELIEAPALPLGALTRRYSATDRRLDFELLLEPGARAYATVEVATEPRPGKAAELLYRQSGSALPPDLVLRLSLDKEKSAAVVASFVDASGARSSRRLQLASSLEEQPRVLVISERRGRESFIERLYPTRRATAAEAAGLDLLSYELVVVDGIPIKAIQGRLLQGLLELSERRTGSILFAADSPEFGTKGENPELEATLPVTLMPRDLKDLPDLGILVMIDVSGSMFGDKLSLAKVTGLELLHNLKSGDLIGLMLFSDVHSWVHEFAPNSSIVAAPELEPITAGGGTDLAPALVEGLDRLSRLAIRDKHAVVITDGVTKPADFQAIADAAKAKGISISAMGIGEDVNKALLERLALRTGGRYYRVGSADEIPALLFEDRQSVARPAFKQGRIPVLALNGDRVAEI
ncbi:MAG TPA: VWA domain-containing protein, partial [Rectinemataceae bacterium]|nr:VWA domain-containing protein [Rectinemataceae bacterium]